MDRPFRDEPHPEAEMRPAPGPPARGYRGRFAPSPTGELHFGSLVAAVGSFADARAHGGLWFVRMEDLDAAREVQGAAASILRTLEAFGFGWDGPVLYQHSRRGDYEEALEQLRRLDLIFPCACSRKELREAGRPGADGPVYPGTCRRGVPAGRAPRTIRVRTESPPIELVDRIQGFFTQDVAREVGDFVVRRADGLHAYQLAVVVDDAFQGVNQVLRGADLLGSVARQMLLQRYLGLPTPAYAHLPLAVDGHGNKLSKSCAAAPVDPRDPVPSLTQAWSFLGQAPVEELPASAEEFWGQAVKRWDAARVPRRTQVGLSG
jgi:glutamyl-Q tRNA(Asp) synthetase